MTLLSLYEKLEKILHRLPEGLHKPITSELEPLKALFLAQRPPRVLLLGERTVSRSRLVNALLHGEAAVVSEDSVQGGTWQDYSRGGGTLRVLDARRPSLPAMFHRAITVEPPDFILFVRRTPGMDPSLAEDIEHAVGLVSFADSHQQLQAKMLGILTGDDQGEDAREQLQTALLTNAAFEGRLSGVLPLSDVDLIAERIAVELPPEAQLEMARLSRNKALQRQIAGVLVKSGTAICAAIAAQPIPLADFPILTSLQATMVASVMHVSGREMSVKLAGEFIGALGANIGAGLVLREGARAAAKFVPGWGNAISSGIAGAGTYAIGRAAVAYFIEGVSLKDARGVFRNKRKPAALLK